MPVLWITNAIPKRCPFCDYEFKWDALTKSDFVHKASHSCGNCGAKVQYSPTGIILQAAKDSGGDMPSYVHYIEGEA